MQHHGRPQRIRAHRADAAEQQMQADQRY